MPPRLTPANEVLRAAVARLGGDPPRDSQLRRWAAKGVIPAAKRRGSGQGQGSTSEYPAGTAEQVIEVMRLLAARLSLRQLPACLFMRGFDVDETRLRSSLMVRADSVAAVVRELAGQPVDWSLPVDDVLDAVDAAAVVAVEKRRRPAALRALASNLRALSKQRTSTGDDHDNAREALLDVTVSVLASGFADMHLDRPAVRALLRAFSGEPQDIADDGADLFAANLADLSLSRNFERLKSCSMEDLLAARNNMDVLLGHMEQSWPEMRDRMLLLLGEEGMPLVLMICLAPSIGVAASTVRANRDQER